jgi:hypothetical protein
MSRHSLRWGLIAVVFWGGACASDVSSPSSVVPPENTQNTLPAGSSATSSTAGATAQAAGTSGTVQPDSGVPPRKADAGDAGQKPKTDAGSDAAKDAGSGAVKDSGADGAVDSGNDGPLNMAPVKFGANVRVNDDTGTVQQTEVAMAAREDGLVFAGWMDDRTNPRSCGYSVSKDGGKTWGKNIFTTTQGSGSAFAGDPTVSIDKKGNLYAGCQDYASGGLGTNYILLAHSKDDGKTWSEFKRINQSLDKPWLGGVGDGTVLVSWLGARSYGGSGGVKRSTDYGATWSEPISLGDIMHGTILAVAPTGLVHMAYNTGDNTVTYRRSKDHGVTFEAARNLSDQGTPCRSPCSPRSHPIIGGGTDPSGKAAAITWASRQNHPDAEGDDDVWVIVSYDSGDTFSEPIRVNDNSNASRQFQSWAAVDKYGAVHVVWTDFRDNGQNATYYARMVDPKAGFEKNVQVTDATGRPASFLGDFKSIAIQGRDVLVIWADTRNDTGDIYFARAKDAAAAGGPLLK